MTNKKKELNEEELKKVSGGYEVFEDGTYHFSMGDTFKRKCGNGELGESEAEEYYRDLVDTFTTIKGQVLCELSTVGDDGVPHVESSGYETVNFLVNSCIKLH